jgi:hypothetical protein
MSRERGKPPFLTCSLGRNPICLKRQRRQPFNPTSRSAAKTLDHQKQFMNSERIVPHAQSFQSLCLASDLATQGYRCAPTMG